MNIEIGENNGDCIECKCRECKGFTQHTVLSSVRMRGFVEGPDIHYEENDAIVQCNGCLTLGFRREVKSSEDYDPHLEDFVPYVSFYPESPPHPTEGAAYLSDDMYNLPGLVQSIYSETIRAISNDLPVLAGVGIRAILEAVCIDLKTNGNNLEAKIDKLVRKSLISRKGADILHSLRLLGNTVVHELQPPTKPQVSAAMKVIDHLLIGAYVIPEEATVLPKYVRKKKAPAKKKAQPAKKGIDPNAKSRIKK